jgi:enoyl-CoA hydratase/carnithine racemase
MGSSEPTIVYDLEDSVACVRLNRPQKLNVFTCEMIDALRAAVRALEREPP